MYRQTCGLPLRRSTHILQARDIQEGGPPQTHGGKASDAKWHKRGEEKNSCVKRFRFQDVLWPSRVFACNTQQLACLAEWKRLQKISATHSCTRSMATSVAKSFKRNFLFRGQCVLVLVLVSDRSIWTDRRYIARKAEKCVIFYSSFTRWLLKQDLGQGVRAALVQQLAPSLGLGPPFLRFISLARPLFNCQYQYHGTSIYEHINLVMCT